MSTIVLHGTATQDLERGFGQSFERGFGRSFEHDSDHGFCTVCGAVWPCATARRSGRPDRFPSS